MIHFNLIYFRILLRLRRFPADKAQEDLNDEGFEPVDAPRDSANGDLKIVHLPVVVRHCKVVAAEGAEQQGQEEVENLVRKTQRSAGGAVQKQIQTGTVSILMKENNWDGL